MSKRTWSDIKTRFAGQWVELADCDWRQGAAHPVRAKVRRASVDRETLLGAVKAAAVKAAGRADADEDDSVVLFVHPFTVGFRVADSLVVEGSADSRY